MTNDQNHKQSNVVYQKAIDKFCNLRFVICLEFVICNL
jgi:hypothetical protein